MAEFTPDSKFLKRTAANPANPSGYTQTATQLGGKFDAFKSGQSALQPWMPKASMLETAGSWYTGANAEGTDNGWNTPFYQEAFRQRDEWLNRAAQEQRGSRFFGWLDTSQNRSATGVATWDDPDKGIEFGDVFQNGKKVDNLYKSHDEATADVMIGEFMFSNDEKARMFNDPERQRVYRERVTEERTRNSEQAQWAKSAEDFDDQVQARQRSLQESGASQLGATAGGAGGGAALGAGIGAAVGSILPGLGTAIGAGTGAVIGAIGGAVGGWLNQDQLSEVAARAAEVTERANLSGYSGVQTAGIALGEFSNLGMRLIAPTSNIVQGLYDAKESGLGNEVESFQAVDANGERLASGWWQGADIAASVADGVLQFSSPFGRWAYMGTMMGSIGGSAVGMTTGAAFNDRRGEFDKFETPGEWVGAIGSVGIDVVQLGVAGALTSAARASRQAAGLTPATGDSIFTKVGDKVLTRGKGLQGDRFETINGIRFGIDDTGKVMSSRITMEALAPSEALRWLPTSWRARRFRDLDSGMISKDDLYNSALEMTTNGSRFTDALINAYAEGGEEFAQALLDPMKFGDTATFAEIRMATLYGAAGGFGMGLGADNQRATSDQVLEHRAWVNMQMRGHSTGAFDSPEWKAQWTSSTPAQKKAMALQTAKEAKATKDMMDTLAEAHQHDAAFSSTIGLAGANSMRMTKFEEMQKRAVQEGNGSLALMGRNNNRLTAPDGSQDAEEFEANAAVMTAYEVINQIENNHKGVAAHLEKAMQELSEAGTVLSQTTDADARQKLEDDIAKITKRIDHLAVQREVSRQISDKFAAMYEQFAAETSVPRMEQLSREMNRLLRTAYSGSWKDNDGNLLPPDQQDHIRRAVEFRIARHPFIDQGSWALLVPQMSMQLTRLNAHSTVYVDQATLKTMGADHDGDTAVPQWNEYLDEAATKSLRRGTQYVKDVYDKDGQRMGVAVVADPPDGEQAFLNAFAAAWAKGRPEDQSAVRAHLADLAEDFRYRYSDAFGGPIEDAKLTDAVSKFMRGIEVGEEDVRMTFVNALWNLDTEGLFALGDKYNMQEALWMLGRINRMYDNLQKELATLEAANPSQVLISEANRPAAETSYQSERARLNAASAATTLSMFGATDSTRSTQMLHYSALYRALAQVPGYEEGGFISGQQFALTELYANLGSGATQSDIEAITGRNAIEQRVTTWLSKIAYSIEGVEPKKETMLLLAMTKVPSIEVVGDTYSIGEGQITLLQLLLRKSLQIEENAQRDAPQDADIRTKIAKLRSLTLREAEHSTTASKAMLEVFGNHKLYDLVGDDSLYIAPHMTLNQMLLQLAGMSNDDRNATLNNLKRTTPYFQKHGLGDPPYDFNVLAAADDTRINAYTMLVDALTAGAQTNFKNMKKRDDNASKSFRDGLGNLHEMMDHHRQLHAERLSAGVSDKDLLEDMLQYRPDLATMIAEKLIPEAARMGVFEIRKDGSVRVANWLGDMLVERNVHRAEVAYFVNTKLAEWNVLGGTVDTERIAELERGDNLESLDQVIGNVRFGRIKSRFLQTVYQVAAQGDGVQMSLLLRAATEAPTLEDLMTRINENPAWLGAREKLLAYHDDVSLFEVDPKDVWNPSAPSSIQRENLQSWGERLSMMNSIMREEAANFEQNQRTILLMQDHVRHGSNIDNAQELYSLLRKAIENRMRFPDAIGPVARDQISLLMQGMLARLHDKGKSDELAGGFGTGMVTANSWGYADGLRQEVNALAAQDIEDIRTNPTKLVEGEVRIMLQDGAEVRIDMSNPEQALAMLADPRTQAFAMAVLFPTVRDVNTQNKVQTYLDSRSQGSIAAMLQEQNYVHLFEDAEGDEKYERDLAYIGTIESGIRRKIEGRSDTEATAMFAPIQSAINEFLVAAESRPGYETMNLDTIRRQVISDVAAAIRAVAAMKPSQRPALRQVIDGALQKHFWEDSTTLDDFLMTDLERDLLEMELHRMTDEYFDQRVSEKEQEIAVATSLGDTAEVTRLESELDVIYAELEALDQDPKLKLPHAQFKSVQAVLNMHTLTGDPLLDPHRKAAILSNLGRGNRINRFRTKDEIELYHKARRLIYLDRMNLLAGNEKITDEEWNKLGSWASATHIAEMTSRSGSEVSFAKLDAADPNLPRWFDTSWSFLADFLFDENILEEARYLASPTRANYFDTEAGGSMPVDEVTKVLENGLLNVKNLGTWTDRVPVLMQRAHKILHSAPVGAAIQLEGNDPKELADYVGSGQVSWEMPSDEHFTLYQLPGKSGQGIMDLLATNWHGFLKLQNHFVRTLLISYPDPQDPANVIQVDLMDKVGLQNFTHDDVANSGLRVLELTRLDEAIKDLQQRGMGAYELTIDFVDVDKLPSDRTPDDRKWANNIFFDGVGRESRGGAGLGAIASLFFGLEGLSKVGQQNPLNMATKKGMGYRAWFSSKLEKALNMERSGLPVAEILGAKALHLLRQTYPTGELLPVDLPSLYKLVKMRHVVVGVNSSGEKEVWWPEDVIALQSQGQPVPLDDMKLVPLSDSVAQTLRGGASQLGVTQAMTRPLLNLADMDPKPRLDAARLKELGITRLGEQATVGQSGLATITLPPRASLSLLKGSDKRRSHILQRAHKWHVQRDEVMINRTFKGREGGHAFDMSRMNTENARYLNQMLLPEAIAQMMHRNGIPFADMTDMTSIKVSQRLARKLENRVTTNNVVWVHKQDQQSDYSRGHLGPADIKNNFAGLQDVGPVLGDIVVIDLSSIMRAGKNYQASLKQARQVIEAYAQRGVTVALTAERGEQELRNALRDQLKSGGLGYRPVADSAHFFEPLLRGDENERNLKALESTLLEVTPFTSEGIALGIVSDSVGTWLSEGTQGIDVEHDTNFTRVSHMLIPTVLTSTGDAKGEHNRLAFNTPVRGTGAADQYSKMREKLIAVLSDPEGRKHLAALSSGYKGDKSGNPKGSKLRRRNKNGTTDPGVLSMEEALKELHDTLEAGKTPLDVGSKVTRGTIIPLVTGDGRIFLSRVGFEIPDIERMGQMMNAPVGGNEGAPGQRSLGIAVAVNKINKRQTVPPPFTVDEVVNDHKGLSVRGTHELNSMAKIVSEGMGLKTGLVPMPSQLQFPDAVMRRAQAPGVRVTRITSETGTVGKEATRGFVDNFRDLFVVTGANFIPDILDVFYGKSRDPRLEDQHWETISLVLRSWANSDKTFSATDIARALDADTLAASFQNEINALGAQMKGSAWVPVKLESDPTQPDDPQRRLVTLIVATLAAPDVKLEHVLGTPGLMGATQKSTKITPMPQLFTDALNNPDFFELRQMLIGRANDVMPKNDKGEPYYWFDEALTFHARMHNGQGQDQIVKGTLQYTLPIPADENAVSLQAAALSTGTGSTSQHIAQVNAEAISARTTVKTKLELKDGTIIPDALDEVFGENRILRFDSADGETLWEMLTRVDLNDYNPWSRTMPMEQEHYTKANGKLRQFTQKIPKTADAGWSEDDERLANKYADRMLTRLNLLKYGIQERAEIDYLVRQFWGRPGAAADQTDYTSDLNAKSYVAAVDLMLENMDKGMHPLHGAQVPLEHMAFWHKVYKAQLEAPARDRWLPVKRTGAVTEKVSMEWAEWVATLHGQFRESRAPFHAMHRTALDGFYHTYQGSTLDFQTMPLSTDEKISMKLMDAETNRLFLSIDPGEDALMKDPVILDMMRMTYEALVGEDPMFSEDGMGAETSPLSEQIARQTAWLRENKITKQKQQSVMDYAREGVHYQESVRKTSALFRSMTNLSITTRLFNPALYISAMFEVPFRNSLEHATNLLTGSNLGLGSGVMAKTGVTQMLTVEEVEMVNNLAKQLGESNKLLGDLIGEMTFQSVVGGGPEKRPWIDRFLERTATGTARATSDPRWGMRNTSVAKRYLEAAIEHLMMTDSVITVPQLVQLLEKDPLWLKKNSGPGFNAHRAGVNRVAQVRSTRPTAVSALVMSPIEAMTSSESTMVNGAGHLLKIPFMFTRFNLNAFMTLTGLNGMDQAAAMFFDQRRTPGVLGRLGAIGKADPYDYEGVPRMDLSNVIESVDLSRAFVRSAVSQTGLMAMGMMAGSLGLGGEDEEARRRRRLAEYMNVPNYLDPREAANDWRWKDAIFLDNISPLDNLFRNETGHSAVVPHWITRQFLSPVLGMQRFFETGNVREIWYGFQDAIAVMPNSVIGLWRDADLTGKLLADAAADLENVPEKELQVSQLFINMVGVYEKALIENSFVNSLRSAGDEFDRNPWLVPMTAEENTGELDRLQGSNLPQQTNALVQYQTDGENPENRVAFMTRNGVDALFHQYAENNATAAILMSLFTGQLGGDSSYARKNMAVRQREVSLGETPQAEAEALILANFLSQGGQVKRTKMEILQTLKARDQAAGVWWDQEKLEAEAEQIYAAESGEEYELAILDPEGKELLGQDGAKAVFKSVKDGIIKIGDPSLAGISISQEMRDKIATEWMSELIQEGVDLGLSDEAAMYRADRFWWGDKNDPGTPGLRALIYDKKIPSKNVATYDQLNVTYVLGPDGKPWATPFDRQSVSQALGIPIPHRIVRPTNGTTLDKRGNVVDLVKGVNTGFAGIVPTQLESDIKPNDQAAEDAKSKTYTPSNKPYNRKPWKRFGSGGGGYGSGGGYYGNFQRMLPIPDAQAMRTDGIQMINSNTPYVRRASVHRERITSERGRLKQWQ